MPWSTFAKVEFEWVPSVPRAVERAAVFQCADVMHCIHSMQGSFMHSIPAPAPALRAMPLTTALCEQTIGPLLPHTDRHEPLQRMQSLHIIKHTDAASACDPELAPLRVPRPPPVTSSPVSGLSKPCPSTKMVFATPPSGCAGAQRVSDTQAAAATQPSCLTMRTVMSCVTRCIPYCTAVP